MEERLHEPIVMNQPKHYSLTLCFKFGGLVDFKSTQIMYKVKKNDFLTVYKTCLKPERVSVDLEEHV